MKLSTETLEKTLSRFSTSGHVYVAYSGGVDSHVLLHLCSQLKAVKSKLVAVHVHHGLQPEADDWAIHCAETVSALNIKFILEKVDALPKKGESPEEAARNARYKAFKVLLSANDILLTAQHREDQAETILLQLFRGAGLAGLAGMPFAAALGKGRIVRPLLDVTLLEIRNYAHEHGLKWVEDPSNRFDGFDRNYLRNQVIPLLKKRWPSLDCTVSRAGRHCADALKFQKSIVKKAYAEVYCRTDGGLDLVKLEGYDGYIRKQLIRCWFDKTGLKMPSEQHLQRILSEVIGARNDAAPKLRVSGHCLRRYRNKLYLSKESALPNFSDVVVWKNRGEPLILDNNGELIPVISAASGIPLAMWKQAEITVSYRQGGEKIAVHGRQGRHAVKKLFQETGIPPWVRERMPMIYLNGRLAAVGELWVADEFFSAEKDENVQIRWLFDDSFRKGHDEKLNVD